MGLDSALSIASGGLANINKQFALISQNVANAATPGYAVEVSSQQSVTADGIGLGVHTGPATLQIDHALQTSVMQQNAAVAGLQTTQTSLQAIDSVLGTPGSGNDLTSLLGDLKSGFSTLLTDPSNQAQQGAVVSSATALAQGINALTAAYSTQRQAAQDGLVSAVATMNSNLATIGQLSNQIIALKATDLSTADLENQRNAAVQTLSHLIDLRTVAQSNGDLLLFSGSGLTLPTRDGTSPFAIDSASTLPGSWYPGGGIGPITLNGTDVTKQLTGGQIGADITLRDTTLPTGQAELDEFAQGLSSRFAAQGLTLFTDPAGHVPTGGGVPVQSGYVGYAGTIQVNAAVTSDPSMMRDGTDPAVTNPDGLAGYTSLIAGIIGNTFGTQSQNGIPQPPMNTSALGANGALTAAFTANGYTLSDFSTGIVSSQALQSAAVTNNLATEQALQTSLNAKVTAISGVNMDTEMSQMLSLQNAYAANARVMSAVHSMFNQLLQTVQ